MTRISRVVHPTDVSPASVPALARAMAMARASRAELTIVHVLAPAVPLVGDGYISPKTYEQLDRAARAYAERQLGTLAARARKAGVRARTLTVDGVPWQAITRVAKAIHPRRRPCTCAI